MPDEKYPTEEKLRSILLERAEEFCELTDTSLSNLGKTIAKDTSLFSQIRSGRNFTVALYTKVNEWLDENWPKEAKVGKGQG